VSVTQNTFTIELANTGEHGAHFYVYSTNRTDGPWRYTVEAGKSLKETFDLSTTSGVYTFDVYGPNGFVRKFAGNAAQTQSGKPSLPEVRTHYDVANGNVFLAFTNKGQGFARLTVIDNAYGARPRTIVVPGGAEIEEAWVLASSHHWYDLTVSSNEDSSYARRLAGHVETGRPSITDPAAVGPTLTAI